MSTKTLRKRVALGTVVALGAGLLSLVSVSSANAAPGDITIAANGATGAFLTNATSSGSQGVLGTPTATSGTTMTATLLSTGTLSVQIASATNGVVTVTGGTISAAVATDNVSADGTLAGKNGAAYAVNIKPNSGVTTMTVQSYTGATATTSSSGGTLAAQIIVTVAGTSVSGVFSAAKSLINTATSGSATNAGVDVVNATTGSSTVIPNRASAYINFTLNDAYGVALANGPMTVSATGGALVAFNATVGTNTTPTNTADVIVDSAGNVTVSQGTKDAGATTTVTIAYKGTTVATYTFTFQGEVAKVTVKGIHIARAGVTTTPVATSGVIDGNQAYEAHYYDAAGNELFPSDSNSATTSVSGSTNAFVTATSIAVPASATYATPAYGQVTCAGTSATGKGAGSDAAMQLQYVNASSGTIVKSNVWTQSCAGDADTYTAKFDKTSYTPGSIGILTITFKDAQGNLTHRLKNNVSTVATATTVISYAGAPTSVVAAADYTTDRAGGGTDADGTKTFQFVMGTTTGNYVAVVDAPTVDGNDGAKQTVAYTIADNGTTLNDVLKGIVSLIASINKQIAALAKLVAPAKKK
jgi:hypothetical protein